MPSRSNIVYRPKQEYSVHYKKGGGRSWTEGGEFDPIGTEDAGKIASYNALRAAKFEKQMGLDSGSERLAAIKAKAEFDAENFEKRYTAKQKAEISQLKKAQQDLANNPNFSDEEKLAASRGVDLKLMGITPSDLPKLSPYPTGRGPGDIWDAPGVGKVSLDRNGTIKVVQPWKDSAEYSAMKNARAEEKEKHKALTTYMNKLIEDEDEPARFPTAEEIRQFQIRQNGYEDIKRQEVSQLRQSAGLPEMPEAPQGQQVQPDITIDARESATPDMPMVRGEEDYKRLASGTEFVDGNGKRWRKP